MCELQCSTSFSKKRRRGEEKGGGGNPTSQIEQELAVFHSFSTVRFQPQSTSCSLSGRPSDQLGQGWHSWLLCAQLCAPQRGAAGSPVNECRLEQHIDLEIHCRQQLFRGQMDTTIDVIGPICLDGCDGYVFPILNSCFLHCCMKVCMEQLAACIDFWLW